MTIANAPIMEFKDEKQAYKCLKEWQERLFLSDWIIQIVLESPCKLDNEDVFGYNELCFNNRNCVIHLAKKYSANSDLCTKFCNESTLVHELLHLKYNWVQRTDSSCIEYIYYDEEEHALIEQMAKSLIMAKYNLTLDWFKNFKEE